MAKTLAELVKFTIELGVGRPYDNKEVIGDDKGRVAAVAILADLTDRRGVKNELNAIDGDIKEELTQTMTNIINYVHSPEFKFEDHVRFKDKTEDKVDVKITNLQVTLPLSNSGGTFNHETNTAYFGSVNYYMIYSASEAALSSNDSGFWSQIRQEWVTEELASRYDDKPNEDALPISTGSDAVVITR